MEIRLGEANASNNEYIELSPDFLNLSTDSAVRSPENDPPHIGYDDPPRTRTHLPHEIQRTELRIAANCRVDCSLHRHTGILAPVHIKSVKRMQFRFSTSINRTNSEAQSQRSLRSMKRSCHGGSHAGQEGHTGRQPASHTGQGGGRGVSIPHGASHAG